MADRRIDRETTKKLRDVADRLLTDLLTDPHVAKAVAEPLIEEAINAGELIPRERLMVAAGFELAPFGRLADLEDAVIGAIEALESDKPDVKSALKSLRVVMPEPAAPEAPADEVETEQGPGLEAEPEPEAESGEVEVEVDVEVEVESELVVPELEQIVEEVEVDDRPQAPMPPPKERPTEDEPGECVVCGDPLEYPVALRSWTRFRALLCDADYTTYKPQPKGDEGDGE